MKTLHLNLKSKWFKMILTGEKLCEYREIKPYWITRLQRVNGMKLPDNGCKMFNEIQFRNGYSKNSPTMTVECKGIEIGEMKKGWCEKGFSGKKCFVIKLGKVLTTKNIN